jgi:hypothetical protein
MANPFILPLPPGITETDKIFATLAKRGRPR